VWDRARVYGFVEQLIHYFDRPHTCAPTRPVGGPAAWIGSDLAGRDVWRETLRPDQADELLAATAAARSAKKSPTDLRASDFPLPTLGPAIARWREELRTGRGFVLVSGIPVDRITDSEAEVACWGLGLHLGMPGAQNVEGDLLGHVTDLSASAEHADERLYRTNQRIRFHCDAADVVGLLCLATAPEGGASRLVSSVSVFDHLIEAKPDLAARLFEPFLLDARRPEGAATPYTSVPPCRFDGERLRTFMHLDYFSSVERHPGAHIDAQARATLAGWEGYAERTSIHLDMQLAPGDLQLVNNHSVVHARTAYTDDPDSPRHLLRLWLSLV
jgi:hypothetical protein